MQSIINPGECVEQKDSDCRHPCFDRGRGSCTRQRHAVRPLAGSSTLYSAYEVGGKYALTTALSGGLGYTYSRASGNVRGQDLQAQIGSSASSFFQPSGAGAVSQVAVRVGIRHKF